MEKRGLAYAMGAFLIWGTVPIFWKKLSHLDLYGVIAYRSICTTLMLVLLASATGKLPLVLDVLKSPRKLAALTLTGALLAVNWLVFAWGVYHGHVLEGSLGYFTNPLLNVLLGVLVLKEKLRPLQWGAVLLAGLGLTYLFSQGVGVPWLPVVLALSFGLYGLFRKMLGVDATCGLLVECLAMTPFAFAYLAAHPELSPNAISTATHFMIAGTGLITVVPFLLFAMSLRHLKLATVGIMQYLSPTLQFLEAVLLFSEPFTRVHMVVFACIWAALALYTWELYRADKVPATP